MGGLAPNSGELDIQPMRIEAAVPNDLGQVRAVYADARARQLAQQVDAWPEFPDGEILAEIAAGRLLLVWSDDCLAGVFTVAYADHLIWAERECGAHVYLHRVARSAFSGDVALFPRILEWTCTLSRALERTGVRVDTWASNLTLIAYYERFGFRRVANRRVPPGTGLPAHYDDLELALLEFP